MAQLKNVANTGILVLLRVCKKNPVAMLLIHHSEWNHIFTNYRPESKVMFYTCPSVILFTGGLPQCMLEYTHRDQKQTPPGPQADTHPGADTLPGIRGRHPREETPPSPWSRLPPHSAFWKIRATSGRYGSCWNAYLFTTMILYMEWNENVTD